VGNIIEVKNLMKSYGQCKALTSVQFNVKRGEIFGFLGPSGAGITTTIKILTGQLTYTEGHVKIFGKDVSLLKKLTIRK